MPCCHIYLIPLRNNPVFKIGNAINVVNRMKNMGVLRHVDHSKVVVISLPDKKSAQIVEKSLHLRLHPFRSTDVPNDLRNGQTEFFGIDAWDIALDYVADLKRGWEIKVSEWQRPRKKMSHHVKPLKPTTLRKRLRDKKSSEVYDRYNRTVFSRYWCAELRLVQHLLIDLRYDDQIRELLPFYKEMETEHRKMILTGELKHPADIAIHKQWFSRKKLESRSWILVYSDPDQYVYKQLTGLGHRKGKAFLRPSVKVLIDGFCLSPHFLEYPINANGYTAFEINTDVLKAEGTDELRYILQQYCSSFLKV